MPLCESCSEPLEIRSVVRVNNRTLRRIVHILRGRIQNGKSYTDELFMQLCESDPTATEALREIREKSGLDCSPDDYAYIVEKAVDALTTVRDEPGSQAYRDPEAAE